MTRTRADLDAAFALLERAVDDYADPEHATTPIEPPTAQSTVIDLQPHRSARRGSWPVAAGAAAVAAVIAGTVLIATQYHPGGNGVAAGTGSQTTSVPRTLPLGVDSTLHMSITEVTADSTSTGARLVGPNGREADLTIAPPHTRRLTSGLTPVDVNGRPGWYSDGSTSGLVEHTDGSPRTFVPSVIWEYAPDAYAFVVIQGPGSTRTHLLRVARGVHIGGNKPLRTAIKLRRDTGGLSVTSIQTGSPDVGRAALNSGRWFTQVFLGRPGDTRGQIKIEATSGRLTSPRNGGQPLTVAGHPAYWHQDRHELDIAWGDNRYVDVEGDATKAQLVAIAGTITLTAHPTDPSHWFDARTALP